MNDLRTLKDKIPQPLKEAVKNISASIYDSSFCQYSSVDIATSIVASAIENRSTEAVAKSPNADTVMWRIKKTLTFEKVEKLAATQKPPKGSRIKILIDGNNQEFYGKEALGSIGGKPKNGTHMFFGYLVAFSTIPPKGIIAIRELFDGSVTDETEKMIDELRKDYEIDMVVTDGEFYKAELIDYLSRVGIHYVTKRLNTDNIRDLNISYDKPYLYESDIKRDSKIIYLKYWIYRYKGRGGDFYLCSDMKMKPKVIREIFSSRWGIETGFRERDRVGIKTTTRDFLIRLFFYVISCIIYNIWQRIRFRYGTLVIRFDDIIECIKNRIRYIMLSAKDASAIARKRHIILRLV